MTTKLRFPFTAFVDQEKLKVAYLANIVNPRIGGLLISGPKGTGKSTIVHSVVDILPDYQAVEGCIFECDPEDLGHFCSQCQQRSKIDVVTRPMRIITLPLSCTEDRLIGSIDIETLLKTGEKEVIPGILGMAHRNILYVDEVNLLPDHLVDDILDAAALHWNRIEREGISIAHPADFVLIGTMNPEEGDLRPQILDRFPLCVKLKTVSDRDARVEIVKRNLLFEESTYELIQQYHDKQKKVADMIESARSLLGRVSVSDVLIEAVARSCADLKVDGQRPDIVITKTAKTLASLDQRTDVGTDDIILAAEMALVHRTRDGGLLEPPAVEEIQKVFRENISNARAAEKIEPHTPVEKKDSGQFAETAQTKKKKK